MSAARPTASIARGTLAVLLLSMLPGLATTQDSPTRAGYSPLAPVLRCASCDVPAGRTHATIESPAQR